MKGQTEGRAGPGRLFGLFARENIFYICSPLKWKHIGPYFGSAGTQAVERSLARSVGRSGERSVRLRPLARPPARPLACSDRWSTGRRLLSVLCRQPRCWCGAVHDHDFVRVRCPRPDFGAAGHCSIACCSIRGTISMPAACTMTLACESNSLLLLLRRGAPSLPPPSWSSSSSTATPTHVDYSESGRCMPQLLRKVICGNSVDEAHAMH